MMEQNTRLEILEVIEATSKKSLYEILNSTFDTYKIVEETKKRNFFLFWKVKYTIKVMVPSKVTIQKSVDLESFSEKLQEKVNNVPTELTEEKPKPKEKEKKEEIIIPVTKETKQTKKRELLKKLDQASALPKKSKTLKMQKKQEVEMNQLKEMLDIINSKLNEKHLDKFPKFEKMVNILRKNGIEEAYVKHYLESAKKYFQDTEVLSKAEIYKWLVEETQTHIQTNNQRNIEDNRIIALVGQTGVGKTTTLVKIGWQLSNKNRSVGFITTDTFRSGAVQQLEGYAEKMGTELIVANGPEELAEAVGYFTYVNQVDHILIDTVGRNYMEKDSIETIKEYLKTVKPDLTCLTFSAVSKSKDMLEIFSKFEEDEFAGFIFTKIDETKTIGGLITVFMETTKPVILVTDGQDVTRNICSPTSELLAKRMFQKDVSLNGTI